MNGSVQKPFGNPVEMNSDAVRNIAEFINKENLKAGPKVRKSFLSADFEVPVKYDEAGNTLTFYTTIETGKAFAKAAAKHLEARNIPLSVTRSELQESIVNSDGRTHSGFAESKVVIGKANDPGILLAMTETAIELAQPKGTATERYSNRTVSEAGRGA